MSDAASLFGGLRLASGLQQQPKHALRDPVPEADDFVPRIYPDWLYSTHEIRKVIHQPLVSMLRRLDRDATFDRFLDLPKDIRLCVYEYLFATRRRSVNVPILSLYKTVYHEALPLFNAAKTLPLRCKFQSSWQYPLAHGHHVA